MNTLPTFPALSSDARVADPRLTSKTDTFNSILAEYDKIAADFYALIIDPINSAFAGIFFISELEDDVKKLQATIASNGELNDQRYEMNVSAMDMDIIKHDNVAKLMVNEMEKLIKTAQRTRFAADEIVKISNKDSRILQGDPKNKNHVLNTVYFPVAVAATRALCCELSIRSLIYRLANVVKEKISTSMP